MSARAPKRIARWRIEAELGSGGMGTVYLARRGDRRAAIKVVHEGLAADPHFRERFRREVEISRRVSGPYVAELLDSDVDAIRPWLASQHVAGPTLGQQVESEGHLSEGHTLALALALVSALSDIHRAGVTHRDLKPSNILLAASGPVVIDFGIAAATDVTSLTRTGLVMGSAGWMAPEQLRGQPADTAADVFAWGAAVSFAATGRPPFGTGRAEDVSYRVVHEEPDIAGVPSRLMPWVSSALAKDPGARPSIPEIINGLTHTVADAPTIVGTPSLTGAVTQLWSEEDSTWLDAPPTRPEHRHHRKTGAAVAIAAVLAAGGGWMAWSAGSDDLTQTEAGVDRAAPTEPGDEPDASTTTAPPQSTTESTTTTSSPPPTEPSTTIPPQTAPPPPPPAALDTRLDPLDADDIARFVAFAENNIQQVVRFNVYWDDPIDEPDALSVQPEWEPGTGVLYARGACPDPPWCSGGVEILVRDLDTVADAGLYYDSGQWVISGRFAVQSVVLSNGGIMSVAIRAVPIA